MNNDYGYGDTNGPSRIVRFETNIPITLALKYDTGKEVEGRYGDQWMYTLADGRTMYVSPIVATKLGEMGIRRGDEFTICKREVKDGKGKTHVEWQVQRLAPAPAGNSADTAGTAESPSAAELTGIDETDLEKQLKESLRLVQMRKAQQSQPVKPTATPSMDHGNEVRSNGNGTANGNGHQNGSARLTAPPPIPLKIPMNIAFREILAFCKQELTAAGEQWADAAKQDLVSTLLIQGAREGWIGPWERPSK